MLCSHKLSPRAVLPFPSIVHVVCLGPMRTTTLSTALSHAPHSIHRSRGVHHLQTIHGIHAPWISHVHHWVCWHHPVHWIHGVGHWCVTTWQLWLLASLGAVPSRGWLGWDGIGGTRWGRCAGSATCWCGGGCWCCSGSRGWSGGGGGGATYATRRWSDRRSSHTIVSVLRDHQTRWTSQQTIAGHYGSDVRHHVGSK